MKNKQLLIAGEYTALGLSVLGTILATTTGQIALAATPLTLALSLNLINRTELTKLTKQTNENIIALVDTRINNLDDSLQKKIQTIEDVFNTNQPSLAEIQQFTKQEISLIKQDVDSNQNNLKSQVNNLDNSLQKQIQTIGNILNTKPSLAEIQQFTKQEISLIKQDIDSSKTKLESQITNLDNSLQKQIQTIGDILNTKPSLEKVQQLTQQEISLIEQDIYSNQTKLEIQTNTLREFIQKLIKTIEHILSSNHYLQEAKQAEQKTITHSRPPQVQKEYSREIINNNPSQNKKYSYSNSNNNGSSDSHKSGSCPNRKSFQDKITQGQDEIRNGAKKIEEGVEDIGKRLIEELRILDGALHDYREKQ